MEIDGQRFTQSLAILEYLDDTRNLGLLPEYPALRAKVRALSYSIAVNLHQVCNLSVATQFANVHEDPDDASTKWMQHFIAPGLEAFERADYFTADVPTLADICLIPQL